MNLFSAPDRLCRPLGPTLLFVALSSLASGAGGTASLTAQGAQDPSLRVPIEHWGCSNCHEPDATNSVAVGKRPGPNLSGIGARNSAEWLKRWIAKPADVRRVPTMPRLFGTSAAEQKDLDALVNFLGSLGGEAQVDAVATEEHVIAKGRALYHTIGCVNCHGALDSPAVVFGDEFLGKTVPKTFVFGPFGDLDGKWYPASLSAFLRDPVAVHPDGRMPNMGLDESESDAIAHFLLTKWKPATAANRVDASKIERGREVLQERNCLACHTLDGMTAPAQTAPRLAKTFPGESKTGCLSRGEWDGPRYDLPMPPLVNMLRGALHAAQTVKPANPRLDLLERQLNRLNCRGCHEIDGSGGIAELLQPYSVSTGEDADLGDEGRFPPHLNGVGNKLTTSWFKAVLEDSGTTRPYLATRMPQFGSATDGFAELFAEKAGVKPDTDREWPEVTDQMLLLGRDMVGDNGISCVTCHSFGDAPALGTPGPDMQQFASRLRYDWWDAYIKNPDAFKPMTRMPKYTDDAGKGVFTNFCNGDFQKQTDAMWAYFSLGEFMPAPSGIDLGGGMMLKVGDRPRVMRTYLNNAGTRGIAVGFPVGIHYSYNGATGQLVDVWQGEFLNASAAWAGRGGGTTGAEGRVLWRQPQEPEIVIGSEVIDPADLLDNWPEWPKDPVSKYRGYRLDHYGKPIFLTSIGDTRIEEGIRPYASPEKRIVKHFTLKNLQPGRPVFLRVSGLSIQPKITVSQSSTASFPPDGSTQIGIVPESTTCTINIEIAL
jgi:mono/diheme cytochrome c family protein